MTVSSGFFNSVNHDRLYDAEQLSSIFDGVIEDGVYQAIGEAFKVSIVEDAENVVTVGTGRAWFDHTWTVNDSTYAITLDPPNEALGRIDAIVLDVDRTQSVRKNSIEYIRGVYSESPQKPALTKSDLHNQYPLAYITMPSGSDTVITNLNIEITVGTSDCPLVIGVLESFNGDLFIQQIDAEFNEWWDGIKDVLDENTATKLQNQINDLNDHLETLESKQFTASTPKKAVMHFGTGTWYKVNKPRALILPDGYLFIIGITDSDKFPRSSYPSDTDDNTLNDFDIMCGLYSLDGVMSQQTKIGDTQHPVSYGSLSGIYTSQWSLVSYDTETYPVTVRVMHLKSVSVGESFGDNYTKWFRPTQYVYTLSTITITTEHVITKQDSDITVPLNIASGIVALKQNMCDIPANVPGNKYFVLSYTGFREKTASISAFSKATIHGLMIDSDGVASLTTNRHDTETSIFGESGYDYLPFYKIVYYNKLSGTIQAPPPSDAPAYTPNYSTIIFNLDGTFKKYSTDAADYTDKNHFENIGWFNTDYNVLTGGYYYHQDASDPNKIVGEKYDYMALEGTIGDMPTISPIGNPSIISSDDGSSSGEYSGLPNMTKANIQSSSAMSSLVREPSGIFIAASTKAELGGYDGGAFRFLTGGGGGIWSGYYGYYAENVGSFGGPVTKAFNSANFLNSQIMQKQCYWSNSNKNKFIIVVPGSLVSIDFLSDGNSASTSYKSEAFHQFNADDLEVWYIEY